MNLKIPASGDSIHPPPSESKIRTDEIWENKEITYQKEETNEFNQIAINCAMSKLKHHGI